jgi:hypothetical protein
MADELRYYAFDLDSLMLIRLRDEPYVVVTTDETQQLGAYHLVIARSRMREW